MKRTLQLGSLACWLLAAAVAWPQENKTHLAIRDLASLEGVRDNNLIGYGMVVGLAVSLFQAVTSINEQTMTFVPKALAVVAVLLLLLPWIVRTLVEFTTAVIQKMPQMVQ